MLIAEFNTPLEKTSYKMIVIFKNIFFQNGIVFVFRFLFWVFLDLQSFGVDPWARNYNKIKRFKPF